MKVSEKFLNLINRFHYNGVVGKFKKVLNSAISDYDYITVSDSSKFINFFATSKVDELKKKSTRYTVDSIRNLTHSDSNDKIFEAIGYNKYENEYWYPSPDEDHLGEIINEVLSEKTGKTYVLFKCCETGRLSVINKEAIILSEPNLFKESKNKLKVGRFITHIFEKNNIEFKSSEIEEFVNLYKSTYDIINDKFSFFELVDGEDIPYWYKNERYESDGGTLVSSCMGNVDPSYFDIYKNNSNCKLLILKSTDGVVVNGKIKSDKICGRALVWNATLKIGDDERKITFMDRIYYNNDSDETVFIKYAQNNGWWYKVSQNYYTDTSITNGDEVVSFDQSDNKRIDVNIEYIFFEKYPYIDTLCYVKDEKTLTNNWYLEQDKQTCHGFRSTGGYYETYEDEKSIKKILE